jgi:hypothetical protein
MRVAKGKAQNRMIAGLKRTLVKSFSVKAKSLGKIPRCARCGKLAVCEAASGEWLCERCLALSIRQRFLAWLRKSKPRPSDSFVVAYRGDLQSYAAATLLQEVEKEYGSNIEVLEIGLEPSFSNTYGHLFSGYKFAKREWKTYTEFRLNICSVLPGDTFESVIVLPDTLEDIAAYTLGEVLLGDTRGLSLEARFRVAYPLAAVSIRELLTIFPHLSSKLVRVYGHSGVKDTLKEISLSIPTIHFSLLSSFVELTSALKRKKDI